MKEHRIRSADRHNHTAPVAGPEDFDEFQKLPGKWKCIPCMTVFGDFMLLAEHRATVQRADGIGRCRVDWSMQSGLVDAEWIGRCRVDWSMQSGLVDAEWIGRCRVDWSMQSISARLSHSQILRDGFPYARDYRATLCLQLCYR